MKYRVSLAVKTPQNFELDVEAENEREAVKKAVEAFDSGNENGEWRDAEFVMIDDADVELDIDLAAPDNDPYSPDTDGVYVEAR